MKEEIKVGSPAQPSAVPILPAVPGKKVYETDGKDRILLFLALGLGILCADLMFSLRWGIFGLGVTILVGLWYGVLVWYCGVEAVWKKGGRLLFVAVCLLALTFGLYANVWFRLVNCGLLLALMTVQLFQNRGTGRPWHDPLMVAERFSLLFIGLWERFGALIQTLSGFRGLGHRKLISVGLGLAVTVPVLLLVVPLLASADALFRQLTGGLLDFLSLHFSGGVARLVWGAALAPLLFGLLYALRRPEPPQRRIGTAVRFQTDTALPITVLTAMDALYLFFVGVQFAALFGGPDYLAASGISYAEYARSGFFQMVLIAVLNLALVLACVQFCGRTGPGWRTVQLLSSALVGFSALMLVSAAWRMTLYVAEYGLSFQRALTYWGMGMLAIFFVAAWLKIWKQDFSFFRIFFAAGVTGYLLLNFLNVDYLVARYNVDSYLSGRLATLDVAYLAYSSYDALAVLDRLPDDFRFDDYYVYAVKDWDALYAQEGTYTPLQGTLYLRRVHAAEEAARWESWSLSAQLAALDGAIKSEVS